MTTIVITDKLYIRTTLHEQNEYKYSLHYLMLEIKNNKEISKQLENLYKEFLNNKKI